MNKLSVLTIIFCSLIMIAIHVEKGFYKLNDRIIESDVKHYYAWIPSVLVYNDISLRFLDVNPDNNNIHFIAIDRTPNGKLYLKTTYGVALMQVPFILPVHYFLKWTGNIADGFSMPYRIALIISSLFYYIMGLLMIRFLVLRKMKLKDLIASLTILIIGLGTNIVIYVAREPALSHVYSFCSIGLFLLLTDKFINKVNWTNGLIMGFAYGLVTLIRPVNAIVGLIPILWGVASFSDLKERVLLYFKNPVSTSMIILGVILLWAPQFMYYQYLHGSFSFPGYGTGERFFFNNPQLINHLFSYRKGWFLYTPAMFFAMFGFIVLYREYKTMFWSVLTILVIMVYVNSSWYSWWFGGSYGQRAYIDIFVLLALPVAALIYKGMSKGLPIKLTTLTLVFLLVFHNMFQVMQYLNSAIHYSGMTKAAYWETFGKLHPTDKFQAYLEMPNMELAKNGIYPKPKKPIETQQEWVEFIENDLRKSKEKMQFLTEKAIKNNLPIDTVIRHDAIYIYKTCYAN